MRLKVLHASPSRAPQLAPAQEPRPGGKLPETSGLTPPTEWPFLKQHSLLS